MSFTRIGPSIAAALFCAFAAGPAKAQTPYYQGKQVKVVVGFSPGGGTDLFGRLIADGLGRHIAGKPPVIVQNMPGAGSVIASNFFSARAPRDGTVLLIGTGQLLLRIVLGLDGAKSRASDVQYLFSLFSGFPGRQAKRFHSVPVYTKYKNLFLKRQFYFTFLRATSLAWDSDTTKKIKELSK